MSTDVASGTASAQSTPGASKRSKFQSSLPTPILSDVPAASGPQPKRYTARKKMVVQGKTYKPGDEIPFANEILRIEGWVRVGYLNEV